MIYKLKFYTLLFSVLLSVLVISCKNNHPSDTKINDKPYVVMLSLDGFRWDYSQKANTPNLDRIAEIGVRAESLRPCFPTKTFPNHYSIATGLYPDNHGMGQISPDRVVRLADFINLDYINHINGSNPVYCLSVSPGYIDEIGNKLKNIDHVSGMLSNK